MKHSKLLIKLCKRLNSPNVVGVKQKVFTMKDEAMLALAKELAKNLKTEADLNNFSRALKKLTVETALNAELTNHLGYEKNSPRTGKNARYGYTTKRLLTDDGEFELDTPRDREGTFEPQLIKKNQTRITKPISAFE